MTMNSNSDIKHGTDNGHKTPDRPEFVAIGKIVKPHGIAGEFKVTPFSQNVEQRFRNLKSFYLIKKSGEAAILHNVTSVKLTPRYVILASDKIKLEDLDYLRDCYIYIKSDELAQLSEGNFYSFELINMRAIDETGTVLGIVSDIIEGTGNDIIEITLDADGRKVMVPFVKAFIKKVDTKGQIITINVMEGLL